MFRRRRLPLRRLKLDYDATSDPRPRWGHGKPAHAGLHRILNRHRADYASLLERLLDQGEAYSSLPRHGAGPAGAPDLDNTYFEPLDSFVLYALIAALKPRRFIEVGSGNTTKFAHRSRQDNDLSMEILSIDPKPRVEVDALCDRVLRLPFEQVDLEDILSLSAGDILFVDGSHRCFMNSDVTVMFLDVLPRLAPGVLVHLHDIFLPSDYPPNWNGRWYSEQYLLGAALLAGGNRYRPLLPVAFIQGDPQLLAIVQRLFDRPELDGLAPTGSSFWLSMR